MDKKENVITEILDFLKTTRAGVLRLLIIAAKVVTASNRDKVRYSVQDSRTPALMSFLKYLDLKR